MSGLGVFSNFLKMRGARNKNTCRNSCKFPDHQNHLSGRACTYISFLQYILQILQTFHFKVVAWCKCIQKFQVLLVVVVIYLLHINKLVKNSPFIDFHNDRHPFQCFLRFLVHQFVLFSVK